MSMVGEILSILQKKTKRVIFVGEREQEGKGTLESSCFGHGVMVVTHKTAALNSILRNVQRSDWS
jgi:hypothetical protein